MSISRCSLFYTYFINDKPSQEGKELTWKQSSRIITLINVIVVNDNAIHANYSLVKGANTFRTLSRERELFSRAQRSTVIIRERVK